MVAGLLLSLELLAGLEVGRQPISPLTPLHCSIPSVRIALLPRRIFVLEVLGWLQVLRRRIESAEAAQHVLKQLNQPWIGCASELMEKRNCIERVTSMRVVSFVSSTHLRRYSLPHEALCDGKPCDRVHSVAGSKCALNIIIWCFTGALLFFLPDELDLIEALVLFWDGEVRKRLLSLELSSAAGN